MSRAKKPVKSAKPSKRNLGHLIQALVLPPSGMELTFADGFAAQVSFAQLGIDIAEIALFPGNRASASGDALELGTVSGQLVSIDSASVRFLVDPEYAERLDAASRKLDIPSDTLNELAKTHHPPQEWFGAADEKPW